MELKKRKLWGLVIQKGNEKIQWKGQQGGHVAAGRHVPCFTVQEFEFLQKTAKGVGSFLFINSHSTAIQL